MKERDGELQENQADKSQKRALKTFWHYPYASLVKERKPPGWDVVVEKILSLAPRSADQLLLRRNDTERRDHEARVMRGLWPHLTQAALLEFKGPTSGLRRGDLARLLSYGWEYLAENDSVVSRPSELTLILAVPTQTPTLLQEFERCEVQAEPLANGYLRLSGTSYNIIVVLLDQVADAEHDDFIRLFTPKRAKIKDPKALRWVHTWVRKARTMEDVKSIEGIEDILDAFLETLGVDELLRRATLEQRLAGLDPAEIVRHLDAEQRLAGLDAEQRLAGLDAEQRLAGLDAEQRLAGLDPEQIVSHLDPEQRLAGLDAEQRLAGLDPEQIASQLDPEQLKQLQAVLNKKLRGS